MLFHEVGYTNCHPLALASNPTRCQAYDASDINLKRYGADVSFVGASMRAEGIHYRQVFLDTYTQWCTDKSSFERFKSLIAEQSEDWFVYRIPTLIEQYFPDFYEAMKDSKVLLMDYWVNMPHLKNAYISCIVCFLSG